MTYQTILFDLDGTLTDPKVGITRAVAYALDHFGIRVEDPDTLTGFIGPPLDEAFPEYYGFTRAQALEAVDKFREYYNVTGWMENIPYPGTESLLTELREAGRTLIVATSKPEETALRVLRHFGLEQYFHVISGADLSREDGSKKANVIRWALERAGVTDLTGAVMVGDRSHDVLGAHAVGLPCIGVLYGYGDRPEHETAGADVIAEDMAALRRLLLKSE